MKKIFFNYKKHKHINYGFFTRLNGFSKGNFSSLNCSISSKDNTNIVKKNIKSAISFLKIKNKKLILPKQMHSNIVKNITKKI